MRRIILLEGEHRGASAFINSAWQREPLEVLAVSRGLSELIELLQRDTSDVVILMAVSFAALFQAGKLAKIISKMREDVVKISIAKTPSDLYIAKRENLVDMLSLSLPRFSPQKGLVAFLFDDVLHTSFEAMEDIPGEVLFQNNLMQLYRRNLQLIERQSSSAFQELLTKISRTSEDSTPSYIGEEAHLKQVFISSSVDVQGYIENSVIFPGVIVRKKTKIINSVIMSNNSIGANVVIQNALLLPYRKEPIRGAANIGSDTTIGGGPSAVRNGDFPDQINDGLTVIGANAEIPRGVTIEQSCYIDGRVPAAELRKLKKVKRGKSLFGR